MRSSVLLAAVALLLAAVAAYYLSARASDSDAIVPVPDVHSEEPAGAPVLRGAVSLPVDDSSRSRSIAIAVVQEATGGRIPSAEITVLSEGATEILRVRTGESGLADVVVTPAAAWLQVQHPAFHPKRVAVPRDRATGGPVRIPLVGRGSLSVTVVGPEGPLSEARVELDIVGYGPDSRIGPISADSRGGAGFPSLPTGATAIVTIAHPGYSTQRRRLDVEPDAALTVRLEPAEFLHLDVRLQGYESTVLPGQRMTLFHRVSDGPLSFTHNIDLIFRHGRAHVALEWDKGSVTLAGQLSSPFDRSRVWQAEALVEQAGGSASGSDSGVTSWRAILTFTDLGPPLTLKFVREPEDEAVDRQPVRDRLVYFAREDSEVRGCLVTDADGRAVIPSGGEVGGDFRFWVPVEGLVSGAITGLNADLGEREILVGAYGGDLVIHGWRGEPESLTVEEVGYGRWPVEIFKRSAQKELVAHLPPGRYRVIAGQTPLGGFEYVVTRGQSTVVELPGANDAVIRGVVVEGGIGVELLRSASLVELPLLFKRTRSTATGQFSFDGLPSGSYVVASRDHEGRPFWHSVELADGEVEDVGCLGPDAMGEVEIALVHADGTPVTNQGVVLWEAPKGSGIKLRLSPDPQGVIRARVRGEGSLAMFGSGWAAVLPARVSPLTVRVPSREQDSQEALPIDLVSPRQREVILLSAGRYGALGTVCRINSEGAVEVRRMSEGSMSYVWDEGWAFYAIEGGRAVRPPRVLIASEYIPSEAHSCRVVLLAAGEMDLRPLGWNRSYALPRDAYSAGLELHVAAGWKLRLDFLGGQGRSVELSVRVDSASIREIR